MVAAAQADSMQTEVQRVNTLSPLRWRGTFLSQLAAGMLAKLRLRACLIYGQ